MIVSGYYGELVVTGDLTPRWVCWFASMSFFLYIVYELLVGLAAATASEADPVIASKIGTAQVMTVISSQGSCVHPVGILCLRYHFQMRRGLSDLPDLLCQIQQAILVAMSQPPHPLAKLAVSF